MNGLAVVGIVLILYAAMVVWLALAKPEKLWNMAKIKAFRKVLGDQGTVIFFYIWAAIFGGLGLWLMIK